VVSDNSRAHWDAAAAASSNGGQTSAISFQIVVCAYTSVSLPLLGQHNDVHSIPTLNRHKVKFTKYKLVLYGNGRIRSLS
jgi:hypothetical protein